LIMTSRTKADAWMPLYIADYLRDTIHLSRDQHGAYLLLLMACWVRGGRLPNDPAQLAGVAKASHAEWRRLAPVILPFFDVDGADLVHGRVVEELQRANAIIAKRREAGALGGRPKKQTESKQKPNGFQNPPFSKPNGKQNETPSDCEGSGSVVPHPGGSVSEGTSGEPALTVVTGGRA
jgi:uncharacterized protein YdaU (DUF1376 family)